MKEEVFGENDTHTHMALLISCFFFHFILSIYIYNIGLVICSWAVLLSILITIWCTFDAAGRSWVKMKKYQRSMRESESRFNYKRSGSMNRNWRQRSVNLISSIFISFVYLIFNWLNFWEKFLLTRVISFFVY